MLRFDRRFERSLYKCCELSESEEMFYPEVDDIEFYSMEQDFLSESFQVYVFPYVLHSGDNSYIDVYVWDLMLYPACYKRFLIVPGYRLSEELELDLLKYLHNDFVRIDTERMKRFNHDVIKSFPEINYIEYTRWDLPIALEHIYFSGHKSGCREILYKSRLSHVAYNLDKLPHYNLIGNTPCSIIENDLPLKLLRILNQPKLVHYLFSTNEVILCKKTYSKYSDYIRELPNLTQWRYLIELNKNNGRFANCGFDRVLYQRLALVTYEEGILELYESFLVLRDNCKKYEIRKLKMPFPQNIKSMVEKMEMFEKCEKNDLLNSRILERKNMEDYEYSDNEYLVIMPSSSVDFCKEAFLLNNCLMECGYASDHAYEYSTVLFVRKKMFPCRPFVTIEIIDDRIEQVYTKNDLLPEKEVFIFLDKYANAKCLKINIKQLINDEVEILEESEFYNPDNRYELLQFANEYVQIK